MLQQKPVFSDLKYVKVTNKNINLKNFPDFFIIGPQRTGTTWLHRNLTVHPEVFMSVKKETYFFSRLNKPEHILYESNDLEWYLEYFDESLVSYIKKFAKSYIRYNKFYKPKIRGEACASYAVMAEDLIDEVITLNPKIKIILTVRNPIQRAWSHTKKYFVQEKGLASVNDAQPKDIESFLKDRYTLACGHYTVAVDKWMSKLNKGHLLIGVFENISNAPEEYLKSIYEFLGVESSSKYTIRAGKKINPTYNDELPSKYADMLYSIFSDELVNLEQRFGFRWDENKTSGSNKVHII